MKNILFTLCALGALALPAVTPRVLLECEALQQRKWARRINPLAAGWEECPGGWLKPFNRVPAGRIDFRTAFRLKAGQRATLEFLDRGKKTLHACTAAGAGEKPELVPARGTFVQAGELQYVRLRTEGEIPLDDLLYGGARVALDWALDEDVPFEVAAGATRALPADPSLLTPDYVLEFSAWVDGRTAFSAGGIDLMSLYRYTPGIWYRFRFEVSGGRARVKLNGRELAKDLPFAGLSLANRGAEPLKVDWVKAFAQEPLPADYPSAPVVPAGQEKHLVGINICSLWREGHHVGWHCIDRKGGVPTVLGYYDEGLPEMADWEIKYFVEHGVDFQAFCWYADVDSGPVRRPRLAYQLEDGFKHARYSDAMKYCLIWEIQNAGRPHTLEDWKNHFAPYFIEHHFKDPRYLVLDGKPVLSVFGPWNLPKKGKGFGSAETTRAAFDWLREEVKKHGFKGVIFVASHWNECAAAAKMGFDVQLPYNYGGNAWDPQLNRTLNENRLKASAGTGVFTPPAVAVGFDNVPWGGTRKPMMTPADFKATLKWMRDDFGPRTWKKGTWQENFQWICTWNEYGEGTYIAPTRDARGFGYLDAVREVFTDAPADPSVDVVPTEAQLARICSLYPQAPWTPTRLALTFDDGLKSHYDLAAPELEKRGWRGLFCVIAGDVGKPGKMTWDDLRDLQRRGHEIANHTLSHPDLAALCKAGETNEVRRQIVEAQRLFGQEKVRTRFLCLPFTRNAPEVGLYAKAAGLEVMTVRRDTYGTWKKDVAKDVAALRAQGATRADFLVHGITPAGGGWMPFADLEAFRKYLDDIRSAEQAGLVSVGPYGR